MLDDRRSSRRLAGGYRAARKAPVSMRCRRGTGIATAPAMRNSRTTALALAALAALGCTKKDPSGTADASASAAKTAAASAPAAADDLPGGAVSVDIAGVNST